MPDKFYTKIKASHGFWEKIIGKQLKGYIPCIMSNNISNELIIATTGKTALDEIKKLSVEYPEEVFKVKIENDDACNNYVHLYECSKGETKLVMEGYEYYFKFNISDLQCINTEELESFKRQTVLFFKHNEHFLPKEIALNLNELDYNSKNNWSVSITYEAKDVRLTATKKGLTCINIDVQSLDYDELPF
jgi:hypothetical protein